MRRNVAAKLPAQQEGNLVAMSQPPPSVGVGGLTLPVLHYLLPDHFDVFKALHAADVVHQDVGIGIANPPAAQIQPLLK